MGVGRTYLTMSKQYYVLKLFEPATPGFCSSDKIYIGTEDELRAVAIRMLETGDYCESAKAIFEYFRGNKAATHNLYREIPILEPVEYKSELTTQVGETVQEHLNCWQWPYVMRFDSGIIHQVIIKYEKKYYYGRKQTKKEMLKLASEAADLLIKIKKTDKSNIAPTNPVSSTIIEKIKSDSENGKKRYFCLELKIPTPNQFPSPIE